MATIRVDLHVKVLDAAVVERAKARGLDALVYAPHFVRLPEIRTRAERYADGELRIVPGREVFAGTWRDRKHVLAVGLSEPVPDFITLDGAMAAFDRQDAAVLVPHPAFMTVSLSAADVRRYRDRIHAVETYNPKHFPRHDRRARAVQEDVGIPPFASSYAHLRGTVGEAWTTFEGVAPTESGLVGALRDGAPRSIDRRSGLRHRAQCAAEFGHLLYENSLEKFDRVVLSGLEATHPDHPAYEGRFDDVAAYGGPRG